MNHRIQCRWTGSVAFEANVAGHRVTMDGDEGMGGTDSGPRPKPLTLASLGGCTGIDVIHILRKMRVVPTFFNIAVEGELTDTEPAWYGRIRVIYQFKRADRLDERKVARAVALSRDWYCGVSAMLRRASEITYEIQYID
ncbi:MAG: OsmC family protein [Spirochaetes bacterium]|nr:OsmC family protein [Spirochaetota bacterium]